MKFGHYLFSAAILVFGLNCTGIKNTIPQKDNIKLVNRKLVNSDSQNSIHLDAKQGAGLAILEEINFSEGIIEVDLLGEDKVGQSFVGIAFNIQNDSTYEAIYFRPFNFHKEEKIRREHGIQYISIPNFDWRKLRTEHEGVYEAEFFNPPAADDWFSIKMIVTKTEVKIFDSSSEKLLLEVKRLVEIKNDKIAFWTGHNSTGGFRNLKIKKQ